MAGSGYPGVIREQRQPRSTSCRLAASPISPLRNRQPDRNEYDALVVAAGTKPTHDIKLVLLLQEAFRHCKALAAWGDGTQALAAAGIELDLPGVLVADGVTKSFTESLADAVGLYRCGSAPST